MHLFGFVCYSAQWQNRIESNLIRMKRTVDVYRALVHWDDAPYNTHYHDVKYLVQVQTSVVQWGNFASFIIYITIHYMFVYL